MSEPTDQEIVEAMVELDDDEWDVEDHEADLIVTMLQKDKTKDWSLSEKQRKWALDILAKYGREM